MKSIKYLLIFLLFIPFIVLAEDCDIDNISIESIELESINGGTLEVEEPVINDKNINLNLKMFNKDDSITYKLIINNNGNDDFYVDEDSFSSDSEYINYIINTEDDSNIVKANSSKIFNLTIKYIEEVDLSLFNSTTYKIPSSLSFTMNKEINEPDTIIEKIINPITSVNNPIMLIIVIIVSVLIGYLVIRNRVIINRYMIFIIGIGIFIPVMVYAICNCNIKIDANIEIEKHFNGTGTIYSNKIFLTLPYSNVDFNMSSMKEMTSIPKWCMNDKLFEDGGSYCNFDSEEDCNNNKAYCMLSADESFNTCRDYEYGFADEQTCVNAIQQKIDSGYIPQGEYVCEKDKYLVCEFGSAYEGDYTPIKSLIKEKGYYKYIVENYIIKDIYICFTTDKEYCLHDNSEEYLLSNYEIMRQQEEWFNENGGSCIYDGETAIASCRGAGYDRIDVMYNSDIIIEFVGDDSYDKFYCLYEGETFCEG